MKIISVKDFKDHATTFIRNEIEKGQSIILTKRRKPIALIKPFKEDKEAGISYLTSEIGRLFKEAGITEKEALEALKNVRNEVYGS